MVEPKIAIARIIIISGFKFDGFVWDCHTCIYMYIRVGNLANFNLGVVT